MDLSCRAEFKVAFVKSLGCLLLEHSWVGFRLDVEMMIGDAYNEGMEWILHLLKLLLSDIIPFLDRPRSLRFNLTSTITDFNSAV